MRMCNVRFVLNITGNIHTCFCNWSWATASTCDRCRILDFSTICMKILEPYLCNFRLRCSLSMKMSCKNVVKLYKWNKDIYFEYFDAISNVIITTFSAYRKGGVLSSTSRVRIPMCCVHVIIRRETSFWPMRPSRFAMPINS